MNTTHILLTRRELEIAGIIQARHLGNPAIAAELFISRETVKSHVSNILSKLEIASRKAITDEMLRKHRRHHAAKVSA